MNLESYRKEFSVFVFDENLHMARLHKESLSRKGYECHFYSSQNLFMQAIYLTLPHIVVLPYVHGVQEMISDVKKISKEIVIILCGASDETENIMALVERKLADDYVLDTIRNIKGLTHRVDQAVEKWLLSMSTEQAAVSDPLRGVFHASNLNFIEDGRTPNAESLLAEVISQTSEDDAIQLTLKNLAQFTGKEFAYLKNDTLTETLRLHDISIGLSSSYQGLGIKYADIPKAQNFLKAPHSHTVWDEFFKNVFAVGQTHIFRLESGDTLLGLLVGLGDVPSTSLVICERFTRALTLLTDNFAKSRWLFDYTDRDRRTDCLNNKAFYEKMSVETSRARRLSLPLSIITFEITCKQETFTNRSAQLVAKILKRFTRSTDCVGRVAENRFAVLFPHTAQGGAAQKAGILLGIIKAALEEKQWLEVYVSAGVNEFPDQCSDSLSLLQGSEEACDQAPAFEVLVNQRHNKRSDILV